MRRVALRSAVLGVLSVALATSTAGAAEATPVVVLRVEGAIDRPLLGYLDDRLAQAERDRAIVVLQLDTSGTLGEDGVALAQRVVDLDVPVLAWVGPTPASASGAGMLLMYASSLAGVAPGSQTGPLEPIDLVHPDDVPADLEATIEGWIDERGKDTRLERTDEPLTAADAIELGIASAAATSVTGFLAEVDGQTVQTPSGPITLDTRIATSEEEAGEGTVALRFDNLGPIQRVAHAISTPSMVYFLLVFGLAALAFEITQPGFGFAGFAGVGLLALAAYGLWVVPPSILGMALLLGGICLMTLDVRLRNLGPLTAVGLIAFGAGSVLAWSGVADAIRISPWLIGGAVVASLLYYGFALTVALQSRDRIVNTQRGLIGLIGEARGKLAPEGPVYVKGAMWRGRAQGDPIAPGAKVRVRGVDGLVLRVEEEPDAEPAGATSGLADPV
ncbi:MAG TPA: NfeD family protein [Actinomycetota bacterium]|nr:NfeD family protein [Actinomycetota bacterium]